MAAQHILQFLMEANKLKDVQRRGITFYGVKKADSALDHSFRMALMVLLFGKEKNINMAKAMKMSLIHDICKVITGDITPYDGIAAKNKKEKAELVSRWRRLPLEEKSKMQREKTAKEKEAFKKLTKDLPLNIKTEMSQLWLDYSQAKSKEARFVQQINVVENLLEAFEGWLANKKFPTMPWWEHVNEVVDDPILLDFIKEISKAELKEICKKEK